MIRFAVRTETSLIRCADLDHAARIVARCDKLGVSARIVAY